jgi:hypothetical protein
MKLKLIVLFTLALIAWVVFAHAQGFSGEELARRTMARRAVEAAIWGMPIVSVDAMRQAFFRDAAAKYDDIVYLSKPADWRFQITTPNASSRYVYIQINTKDGAVVLDIPPAVGAGLFGSLNDAWQVPVTDIGPQGQDRGKGAKYLILPPDYDRPAPVGYIPVRLATYNGYSLLRAIPLTSSPTDVTRALDLARTIRVYPLAEVAPPSPQRYIDMTGKLFDGIAPFDDKFYDRLAQMVNEEPVQRRDFVAMGQLRSLGIEKGKPFKPDAATRELLRSAIAEARAGFIQSTMALPTFATASRWTVPATAVGPQTTFTFQTPDRLELDGRGALFFLGCGPAKKPGIATFYLVGSKDAKGGYWFTEPVPKGALLTGGKAYHLHVPPNVPAKQFWAVTVYDLESAGFLRDAPRVELNSYDRNMQERADGSVDVFFGPVAPTGKETNWIYTAPGKPWFVLFRFYAPGKEVFDKTWILPDIIEEEK